MHLIYAPKGRVPQVKRYLSRLKGQAVHSIWTDVYPINPMSKERMGFQTQKPRKLLESARALAEVVWQSKKSG
jgi:hypothetical protein